MQTLWPFLWVYDNISSDFFYLFFPVEQNLAWNVAGKSPETVPSGIYKVLINIKQQETDTIYTHDLLYPVPTPLQFIWKLPKKTVS